MSGISEVADSLVFQAGTKATADGVVTAGGRVAAVTSVAGTLEEALATSYRNVEQIAFEGKCYRKDIGWEFAGK